MKGLFAIVLLATGCATHSAPPPRPLTELPEAVVNAMCLQFHAEGMTSEVRVVNMTQPIVTPGALRALSEGSFKSRPLDPERIRAIALAPLIPVEVPPQTCVSRFVTPKEAERANDVMIIQFSSPFENPFSRGQHGTLVRLSLGGADSTWYWIPLAYRNDHWLVGAPASISVIE